MRLRSSLEGASSLAHWRGTKNGSRKSRGDKLSSSPKRHLIGHASCSVPKSEGDWPFPNLPVMPLMRTELNRHLSVTLQSLLLLCTCAPPSVLNQRLFFFWAWISIVRAVEHHFGTSRPTCITRLRSSSPPSTRPIDTSLSVRSEKCAAAHSPARTPSHPPEELPQQSTKQFCPLTNSGSVEDSNEMGFRPDDHLLAAEQ